MKVVYVNATSICRYGDKISYARNHFQGNQWLMKTEYDCLIFSK